VDTQDKYARTLTEAMDAAGIKNVDVAKVASVGSNNVAHWRAGRRPVPADRAMAIAALLGVPPERISKAFDLKHRGQSAMKLPALRNTEYGPCPDGHLIIQQLEGFGRPDGLSCLWVPEIMLRREAGLIPLENLRWTTQHSRTMEPTIKRQAIVLLDITSTQHEHVVDGGIYAFTLYGRPDIRRFTIRRDEWALTGQAPDVDRTVVHPDELDELRIFGAVIGWL
jgi:DNA-binding transcriptional regulator YdaS (Cro superfamily)